MRTDDKVDKGLVFVTFLVTVGAIFFSFGMVTWFFKGNSHTAWIMWLFGLGMWSLATAIFLYFMNDPYPRHGRDR